MVSYRDFTDPRTEAAGVADVHRALLAELQAAPAADSTRPSRLPGWTVGHVITHLARNADSHVALLAGDEQYDEGWAGRYDAIDRGASRPWNELVDDLAESIDRIDSAYAETESWDDTVGLLAGPQPAGFLPLARRRELELHWVDLDLGRTLDDIPIDYVTRDLAMLEAWWIGKNRTTAMPAALAALQPRHRWCWLVGRAQVDGVAPAALF